MSELTKKITNNNKNHSQLVQGVLAKGRKHKELIAALVSGMLILMAWAFHDSLPEGRYITLNVLAFFIGGYAKAKEGITETLADKTLNVELLMILAAIGAALSATGGRGDFDFYFLPFRCHGNVHDAKK